MATQRTIRLKGSGLRKEGLVATGVTITPGMLVDTDSTGVILHGDAAENAVPAFAVENEVVGEGIDTDYVAESNCIYEVMQRGTEVHALVAASAVAIVEGDFLESDGAGMLRLLVDEPAVADTVAVGLISNSRAANVARAMEAVDNSGGGVPARIIVEVV